VAYSPKQRDWTPECLFKFTFEGFWPLDTFRERPLASGANPSLMASATAVIELSTCCFNLLDLADQDLLNRAVVFGSDFAQKRICR
jgi:hypothetical protein